MEGSTNLRYQNYASLFIKQFDQLDFGYNRTSEKYLFSAVESGKLQDVKLMLSSLTVNPRDKVCIYKLIAKAQAIIGL